jgi:hypothetical protein
MSDERPFTLRQIDQARGDLYANMTYSRPQAADYAALAPRRTANDGESAAARAFSGPSDFSRILGFATSEVERASSICGNDLPKLTNSTSMSRAAKQSGQLLLNHREQQHHPRDDDSERTTSARRAAEALFTPKRQPAEPSVSDGVPSAEQPARKPRVLAILSPPPVRSKEIAAPVDPEPRTTRHIPRSHHARIRTWVEYGLTVPQVAEVYGVAVGVIERILRQA